MQKNKDAMLIDDEAPSSSKKAPKTVKMFNEKTQVEHVYNAKTMKDQFGNYPVWYKRQLEKRKKKIRGSNNGEKSRHGRRQNLFTATNPYMNVEY